jgi:glucose/mannose-6-phosphate isomerase
MPIDLNSRADVESLDPKGMYKLIEAFPAQCREALAIAEGVTLPALERRPAIVLLSGMGGSAAGGDFVRALFEDSGNAAFQVIRDYTLPNYVGVGDLLIVASYSGNTEETLSVYEKARHAGASIIAITSGGKLKALADEHGYPVYVVPGGQPPRSALGYMLIPAIHACQSLGLIPPQDFAAAFDLLDQQLADYGVDAIDNPTKALAQKLTGTITLLYGLGGYQALIANRWRCQINENAKHLAFVNAYPELCHNEIVGWEGALKQSSHFAGVVLTDGTESAKMKTRAAVTEQLTADKCEFTHVQAEGESLLERMLSLTYYGDWVSIYLARLNEADPVEIVPIDTLKEELAKVD